MATKAPAAPLSERLPAADVLREAGNSKFREGGLAAAQVDYEKVTSLITRSDCLRKDEEQDELRRFGAKQAGGRAQEQGASELPAGSDEEDDELRSKTQACWVSAKLNLALCHLRVDPVEAWKTLEHCEDVLDIEPDNAKATFRKGKALIVLEEFKEAEWELARACRLAPGDSAPRRDLEALRKRLRDEQKKEREAFQGLFGRGQGFASDGRNQDTAVKGKQSLRPKYTFLRDLADNPFADAESPADEALRLQSSGELENAIWAWEAGICKSRVKGDWPGHFSSWLSLARLFMDLNLDVIALRCLDECTASDPQEPKPGAGPPPEVFQNALLLRAVCLLNEAEEDAQTEVTAGIEAWLAALRSRSSHYSASDEPGVPVEERLRQCDLRESETGGLGVAADIKVAMGLLDLVHGRTDGSLAAFAAALRVAEGGLSQEASCFGPLSRRSTRWNMVGAILANTGREQQALSAYTQALRLQPHYVRALTNQGIAFQALGDNVASAASFASAVAVAPDWAGPNIWPLLQKVAEDQNSIDGLAEAAKDRSLAHVQALMKPTVVAAAQVAAAGGEPSAKELLDQLGITVLPK